MSSDTEKIAMLGLTYDDVLLLPDASEVVPSEVRHGNAADTNNLTLQFHWFHLRWIQSQNLQWPLQWQRLAASESFTANLPIDAQVTHVKAGKNVWLSRCGRWCWR